MTTHTPGPWAVQAIFPGVSQTFEPRVCILAKYEGSDVRIADVPDVANRDCEEMKNAHLMAAAPDLLAALQRFAHWYEQNSAPELQGIACDAFQAIAKAGA